MIGMFLVGSGAAIENVLLPSLVKRDFPSQIGLVTGLYSSVMNIIAALASGISVPLSQVANLGWRGSLASWVILSLAAMVVWLPQLKRRHGMGTHRPMGAWRSAVAWPIIFLWDCSRYCFMLMCRGCPHFSMIAA
jgi:CP family cyanate transporter-like MFS transporter